jgi:hypothetical protein
MSVSTWGNPFTHEEHWRETLSNADQTGTCTWCGQRPARLYRYGSGRFFAARERPVRAFCNRSCAESYEGPGT